VIPWSVRIIQAFVESICLFAECSRDTAKNLFPVVYQDEAYLLIILHEVICVLSDFLLNADTL
jgi:hypothetical protein